MLWCYRMTKVNTESLLKIGMLSLLATCQSGTLVALLGAVTEK